MAVTLSASLIANIVAQNPTPNNPRTAEEWIIGAINYLHSGGGGGGGGDILADGSVDFTGQETFQSGLIAGGSGIFTDTITENGAGVTITTTSGNDITLLALAAGNVTLTSAGVIIVAPDGITAVGAIPAYANNAAAVVGIGAGKLYYTDVAGEYLVKLSH